MISHREKRAIDKRQTKRERKRVTVCGETYQEKTYRKRGKGDMRVGQRPENKRYTNKFRERE